MPWTGLILLYEWTFTLFFIIFGSYLSLVYKWGNRSTSQIGSSDSDSRKGFEDASHCPNNLYDVFRLQSRFGIQ